MKTVIGVDFGRSFREALQLVDRLEIAQQYVRFISVIEPMPSTGWFAPTGYVPPSWESELRHKAEMLTESAVGESCSKGIKADGEVIFGMAADVLIAEAEKDQVDLVAVGRAHKSRVEGALLGSVGRALTLGCKTPVLLARNLKPGKSLTVVLATDHSPYAEKCIDRFLSWAPAGVSTIHVVTAVHVEGWFQEEMKRRLPQIGENFDAWMQAQIAVKSEELVHRLEAKGYKAYAHVLTGHPNDVLHHAVHGFGADLLVVGGQGHGFLERLIVGSVALHQAVAEDYSVLIMRP